MENISIDVLSLLSRKDVVNLFSRTRRYPGRTSAAPLAIAPLSLTMHVSKGLWGRNLHAVTRA